MTSQATAKETIQVAAGDLRPGLMQLLGDIKMLTEVLLAAPGLLPDVRHQSIVAEEPWRSFSVQRSGSGWVSILEAFGRAVDRLPQTTEWERQIVGWLEAIATAQLRLAYWPKAPLFSRIISRNQSTLTLAEPLHGHLDQVGYELRVELTGAEHLRARQWFEERFREATDVSPEVAECLRQSWAGGVIDPADAYYKVLAEYFSGVVHGLDVEADDNPMLEYLTEFQQEAYHYAKSLLRRFGGVFLADVVGLGKTYIAMAMLCHLQRRYGEHAVVVAPPKVLPAWAELAREFRVEVALVSHGKLADLDQYADREVLVVDESHNFRNADTDRYERIASWVRHDGSPAHRKVLLLSATPQNSDPLDVKHQLGFFPDNFTRLPYRGESLDAWFKDIRAGNARLGDMLQHIVVRRTRTYIKRAYPGAVLRKRVAPGQYEDTPLHFPTRLSGVDQCLRYSIAETYHGGIYDKIMATLASLKFPIYGLGAYILPQYKDDVRLQGQRRAGSSVRGLFKVLLLKRFESSAHAFKATLGGLQQRLEAARARIGAGLVRVAVRRLASAEDDDDELVVEDLIDVPASMFDAQLAKDLTEDLAQVRSIAALVQDLGPGEDAKLARLRRYLEERPPTKHRTIIFTQFADTAEYLGENLGNEFGRTQVVSGRSGGALSAARRFSPVANRAVVAPEEQLDLLVSTDMLSEGVNLQDADTLINYDLHWNPVRLIQRAGRIDRIGSSHIEIHVASFLPESQLDAGLGLEEVLRRRIAEFISVFGEDSAILPGADKFDLSLMTDAYSGKGIEKEDENDELDGLSRHADRLLQLRRSEPERFARIVAIRSGRRSASTAEAKSVVAARLGWLWAFWDADARPPEELDTLTGLDLLFGHAESAPREIPPQEGALQLASLQRVRDAFEPMSRTFRAQRMQPRLTPAESFVLDRLEHYLSICVETRKPLVMELLRWVREGQAQAVLPRKAKLWKRDKLSAETVFNETRAMFAHFPRQTEELGEAEVVVGCFGREVQEPRRETES